MKKGLIILSNGTADLEALDRYENVIKSVDTSKYKQVIKAFSSEKIIGKLKSRYDLKVPNLSEALEQLITSGIEEISVATLFLIEGKEYEEAKNLVNEYRVKNKSIRFNISHGALIEKDKLRYCEFINRIKTMINKEDEIVMVAHGSSHSAKVSYFELEERLSEEGYSNVHIAAIEGEPSFEQIVNKLRERNVSSVLLQPLLFVLGFHGKRDLLSDNENSWKSRLSKEGFEVKISYKVLSEIEEVMDFIINNID
ncbi:sirohydrochlorin cobaltochelatase [Clostridium sp. C8-1-8]|uniref:sirohydrochlorin cobaltochelatase n=1 Tax=Clostridium sp. C8-1-8 TaxID=2698831 RepID=UPI00136A75D5|nr:sirohydrochlorin cobaltochelatase [Clostridium sp. C8-1-8]